MAKLGDLVRDELTGFIGIVTGRAEYLYEATSCLVHPRDLNESGAPKQALWLEEDRLVVTEEQTVVGFRQVAGKALHNAE